MAKVSILLLIVNVVIPNILKLLTFTFFIFSSPLVAQEIWKENFHVPEKGVWGNENGTPDSDFSEITKWILDFSNTKLINADDYAKTVSTAGGRFECRDIDGEVIWKSETIEIAEYDSISIELTASETGNGENQQNKFLKAFFILNGENEISFETNGTNLGNWGSNIVSQKNLKGQTLQLVIYMANHYSSDKVILDEILVSGKVKFSDPINKSEVLINEVLFNPFHGGSDFVEIVNISDKHIPLNQLYIASRNEKMELVQIYSLAENLSKLQPGGYLALTKDTNGVFPWFTIECPKCFIQLEKFPSYNNDNDYVVLLNRNKEIIDEFYYSEKMHSPVLADREGISLERISFLKETNDKNNWYSAAETSGYGTPGYQNSQFENEAIFEPIVTFEPESFSPNSDGFNDVYQISFELEKPGYITNIWIFDAAGRLVTQLAKNKILGTSDRILWNGETENRQKLQLGVYLVAVEIFDTEGQVKRFKDGVVLTDILN